MKIVFIVMCACCFLPAQFEDTDRYTYCESCLAAAQEIHKTLKETPSESKQRVFKKLIRGEVCDRLPPKDEMTSSCLHLLETHYDRFSAVSVNKEPKRLDIVLCYEQSTACMGVKHQSFDDSKTTFKESDIYALLQNNTGNVRTAQPIRQTEPSRNEL